MNEDTPSELDWDDDPEFNDEDDGFLDDCGMTPSGQCTMAGSEQCDWDCELMRGIIRRQIKAKQKKAGKAKA